MRLSSVSVSCIIIVVGAIVHDTGMYLFHQMKCSSAYYT